MRACKYLLFLLLPLTALFTMAASLPPDSHASFAADASPHLQQTPQPTTAPGPTPTPTPGGVTQIIHKLLFPAETISEALTSVFNQAAEDEAESLSIQTAQWASLLGEVLQAPSEGYYQAIAQSSLPVAAALAPALFLLRLALYHWVRLIGGDDSALRVIGDWVAAGALAVAAGPFLDLLTRLGWWIAGATLGETAQLAEAFVDATSLFSVLGSLSQVSLFSGVLVIAAAVGGVLAMAGMLFAFAATNAALYVMAVVAAPLAVAGVVPHMRWLRSLWLKAVALLVLMPVAAGGIFKAGVTLGLFFSGSGLLSVLIRLLWLWGATGFLLALASILSRVTLSASVEALGELSSGVKAIVSTAVLAGAVATGTGSGAAGGLLGGFGGGWMGAGDRGSGGAVGSPGGGTLAGDGTTTAALEHLDQAQDQTHQAGAFQALGLHAPANYARTQARSHELAARKLELQRRLERFSGADLERAPEAGAVHSDRGDNQESGELGFSSTVDARILSSFSGEAEAFQVGFRRLTPYIERAELDPSTVAQTYPEETARMVRAYLDEPAAVDEAENPLLEAARRGRAEAFMQDVFGNEGLAPNESGGPKGISNPPAQNPAIEPDRSEM